MLMEALHWRVEEVPVVDVTQERIVSSVAGSWVTTVANLGRVSYRSYRGCAHEEGLHCSPPLDHSVTCRLRKLSPFLTVLNSLDAKDPRVSCVLISSSVKR